MLTQDSVSWVDLALDLWVSPDGSQAVLDREEFEALDEEIQQLVADGDIDLSEATGL